MKELFDEIAFKTSRMVTHEYSTSFSLGISMLDASLRNAICSIYGFVRFADEIVDTFHDFNKEELLQEFEADYYNSYRRNISMNPVLQSFQLTVKKYNIDDELIQAFLRSMKSDLSKKEFDTHEIKEYIYGSADVVGLMCLKVFVNGDESAYSELKPYAMRLGTAFQKVNFLRDLKNDVNHLQRVYFPVLNGNKLTNPIKKEIIDDINEDFRVALEGIKKLPKSSRLGVYAAYLYYKKLTEKIERINANLILSKRVRISNARKIYLLGHGYLLNKLNLV